VSDLISEFSTPQLLAIYSVIIVVCLEKWLILPEKFHPLTFARLVAAGMAYKVNSRSSSNALQQIIAGTLAPLVLLTPFVVILVLLMYLAEYPIFFEALLLYIALSFEPIMARSKKIENTLKLGKKVLARHQLQTMVLRKTANLSSLGIAKACIESLLLRFCHQYCTVLLLYLVGGGVVAIGYRLLFEFSHCWHSRLPRFRYFAKPVRLIVDSIQWLPARLTVSCFILAQHVVLGWRAFMGKPLLRQTRFFILNVPGAALGIQLGGPVYYTDEKFRFNKCGGPRLVINQDIARTIVAIRRTQWIFLTMCIIVSLLLNIGIV
jgi:adenosylcobinamide-phosphate synthase